MPHEIHPQEILDTTIKHSPGAIREAVEPRPASATLGKTPPVASIAAAGALALSSISSVDSVAGQQQLDGVAAEGGASEDADASCDPEAEGDSDGGGDQVAIDEAAAVAAATAAAAEELAAAESHSLTQGAMKLVYLLAIQVRENCDGCRGKVGRYPEHTKMSLFFEVLLAWPGICVNLGRS